MLIQWAQSIVQFFSKPFSFFFLRINLRIEDFLFKHPAFGQITYGC